MNAIKIRIKRGKNTEKRESLRFTHRTVLPIKEKRIKDTRMGQKEVCTARKGEVNIKEL